MDLNSLDGSPEALVCSYLEIFDKTLDDVDHYEPLSENYGKLVSKRIALMQISMRGFFGNKSEFQENLHAAMLPQYVRYPFNILQLDPIKRYFKAHEGGSLDGGSLGGMLRDIVVDQV